MTATFRIFTAFAGRDWALARSYRFSYVMSILNALFQLIMYFSIGQLVDRTGSGTNAEFSQGYFSFAVIGIAVLGFGTTATGSFASTLRSEQMQGSLEALLATPISARIVVLASASYSLIFAAITTSLTIGLAIAFFGLRFEAGPPAGVAALVAFIGTIALYASIGIVGAAVTLVYKQGSQFIAIIAAALAVFSGAYYPVEVLPGWLPSLARLLPLTWGFEALRSALLDDEIRFQQLGLLVASAGITVPAALWLLDVALRRARSDGSLAQY